MRRILFMCVESVLKAEFLVSSLDASSNDQMTVVLRVCKIGERRGYAASYGDGPPSGRRDEGVAAPSELLRKQNCGCRRQPVSTVVPLVFFVAEVAAVA